MKDETIIEEIKAQEGRLTSYINHLVGPIDSTIPALILMAALNKDAQHLDPKGLLPIVAEQRENLQALVNRIIKKAIRTYHNISNEASLAHQMETKVDEDYDKPKEWFRVSQLRIKILKKNQDKLNFSNALTAY
ncbi:hypothetical protein SUGI_0122600 [Cryptomeria japonica]|nr:hypothetical protein SUGI_0122600 [Cryptomeria japonica]